MAWPLTELTYEKLDHMKALEAAATELAESWEYTMGTREFQRDIYNYRNGNVKPYTPKTPLVITTVLKDAFDGTQEFKTTVVSLAINQLPRFPPPIKQVSNREYFTSDSLYADTPHLEKIRQQNIKALAISLLTLDYIENTSHEIVSNLSEYPSVPHDVAPKTLTDINSAKEMLVVKIIHETLVNEFIATHKLPTTLSDEKRTKILGALLASPATIAPRIAELRALYIFTTEDDYTPILLPVPESIKIDDEMYNSLVMHFKNYDIYNDINHEVMQWLQKRGLVETAITTELVSEFLQELDTPEYLDELQYEETPELVDIAQQKTNAYLTDTKRKLSNSLSNKLKLNLEKFTQDYLTVGVVSTHDHPDKKVVIEKTINLQPLKQLHYKLPDLLLEGMPDGVDSRTVISAVIDASNLEELEDPIIGKMRDAFLQ